MLKSIAFVFLLYSTVVMAEPDCKCDNVFDTLPPWLDTTPAPVISTCGNEEFIETFSHCQYLATQKCAKKLHVPLEPYVTSCGGEDSEYTYSDENRMCYNLHSDVDFWEGALVQCNREGGSLAVARNEDEAKVLARIIKRIPDFAQAAVGVFLDLDSGIWKTVYGPSIKDVGFDSWAPGLRKEDLKQFRYGYLRGDARLINYSNQYKRPFLCEKEPWVQNRV